MTKQSNIDFSTLLANYVHDVKNSLGMLLGSIEQIRMEKDDDPRLATLQYEATRINNDFVQLLGMYRLEKNNLPFHIDECFLDELLEDQYFKNAAILAAHNIEAEVICDSDLVWYLDQSLIGGVINNVIVNALRYTKEKMQISAKEEDGKLIIEVCDDGPGYPKFMLDEQERNQGVIDFGSGSTNLGLYFASQIASDHQRDGKSGSIHLSNGGPLGGSVFRIILP